MMEELVEIVFKSIFRIIITIAKWIIELVIQILGEWIIEAIFRKLWHISRTLFWLVVTAILIGIIYLFTLII